MKQLLYIILMLSFCSCNTESEEAVVVPEAIDNNTIYGDTLLDTFEYYSSDSVLKMVSEREEYQRFSLYYSKMYCNNKELHMDKPLESTLGDIQLFICIDKEREDYLLIKKTEERYQAINTIAGFNEMYHMQKRDTILRLLPIQMEDTIVEYLNFYTQAWTEEGDTLGNMAGFIQYDSRNKIVVFNMGYPDFKEVTLVYKNGQFIEE